MNLLNSINDFGAIDAENDKRLGEYFYHTQVLDELFEYKRSIIIGRKGSGKTAIYKYMQSQKGDMFSPLLFKDYPWKLHDRYKSAVVSARESYVNSWTFYFYIEIFKRIVLLKNHITNKTALKTIKKLEKWIKNNWGSSEFDHREVMLPHRRKFRFTFNPQIFGNGLGSVSRDLEVNENISGTLSEYNRKFDLILKELVKYLDGEVILGFDELDLAYDPDDKNYKDRLIGLLLTAYSFFQNYRDGIRIFVFLRSDIFNILDFQDKNKIKDNMVVFLDWDGTSTTSKLSLKNMVTNRIRANIQSSSNNFEQNWYEIFESSNIGRNQFKWNFIVERTFLRPRDLIKFLNLSLDQAKMRLQKDPGTIDKITNGDIHNVRAKYSTYLFDELKDEMSSKYPDFNNYLEILRNHHRVIFTRNEFLESYNNIKGRLHLTESADIILERLYEFSIIGFYKPGGGGYGGAEYRFQYKSDFQTFNPQAKNFRVHSGFKEYLELIE